MAVLDLRVLVGGVPAGTVHQDLLRERLLEPVAANCRRSLALL